MQKTLKIRRDLGQLSTFTANISKRDWHIDKRWTALLTTVSTALNEKFLVNFGLLTTKLCLLISTYPTSIVRAFSNNFRLWSHISRERIEISINEKRHLQLQSIHVKSREIPELGFTNKKVLLSHFEPPKFSIAHVYVYMTMQLRSGHVTLLQTKFQPLSCPQSDLRRRAALRWALPHISSLFIHLFISIVFSNSSF